MEAGRYRASTLAAPDKIVRNVTTKYYSSIPISADKRSVTS